MAPLVAEVPTAPQLKSRQIYIVDKPGAAQSQIRIGWVGVPRSTRRLRRARSAEHDPRRLVHVAPQPEPAREERLQLRRELARSTCGCRPGRSSPRPACRPTRPAEARRASSSTSSNAIVKPIPDDELAKAKNYVALSFPGEFETTGDLARKLEELVVYNLPEDTFSNFVSTVTKVTAADLQKLAARYIQADKMAVVVVGDRKTIEGPIRQLNLGPINFITIDELFQVEDGYFRPALSLAAAGGEPDRRFSVRGVQRHPAGADHFGRAVLGGAADRMVHHLDLHPRLAEHVTDLDHARGLQRVRPADSTHPPAGRAPSPGGR